MVSIDQSCEGWTRVVMVKLSVKLATGFSTFSSLNSKVPGAKSPPANPPVISIVCSAELTVHVRSVPACVKPATAVHSSVLPSMPTSLGYDILTTPVLGMVYAVVSSKV